MSSDLNMHSFLKFSDELLNSKTINNVIYDTELLIQTRSQLKESTRLLKWYNEIVPEMPKPFIKDYYKIMEREQNPDFFQPNPHVTYYAITITFDPNRFKDISITPINLQKRYIKKVIMKLLEDRIIGAIYGSYEYHKCQTIVHFHGIIPSYLNIFNYLEIKTGFKRHFTNNVRNEHCIVLKPVDDLDKWIAYINKLDENNPDLSNAKEKLWFTDIPEFEIN